MAKIKKPDGGYTAFREVGAGDIFQSSDSGNYYIKCKDKRPNQPSYTALNLETGEVLALAPGLNCIECPDAEVNICGN